MSTSPFVAIHGRRFLPVYLPAGALTAAQVDALVSTAKTVEKETVEYAPQRTFGPADALLAAGHRSGLTAEEMDAVAAVLPRCGYAGLLLREYDQWPVARTQAAQMRHAQWFTPYAETVTMVSRKIEPNEGRYGVFLVDRAALEDRNDPDPDPATGEMPRL